MPSITDPARELAEVCEKIAEPSKQRGDDYLAGKFGVGAWSTEFYQIVFCFIERADALIGIVDTLDMDEDLANDAKKHIKDIKGAFAREALSNAWNAIGVNHVRRENVQAIKMLSPHVRQKVSYPKLNDEEIGEVIELITELEKYLSEHQLKEHDFIRRALIDGIRSVRFRLERVGWLGWGYTVASIREVIGAYLALQSGMPDAAAAPDAEAVLMKVGAFLKVFYEKTGIVKTAYDRGKFLLEAYGAAALVYQASGVAGLIAASAN